MYIDYLEILRTIILALIGTIVGCYFTSRKDINQKRRYIADSEYLFRYGQPAVL